MGNTVYKIYEVIYDDNGKSKERYVTSFPTEDEARAYAMARNKESRELHQNSGFYYQEAEKGSH